MEDGQARQEHGHVRMFVEASMFGTIKLEVFDLHPAWQHEQIKICSELTSTPPHPLVSA